MKLHVSGAFLFDFLRFGCFLVKHRVGFYSRTAHNISNIAMCVWERVLERVLGLKSSVCIMSELN